MGDCEFFARPTDAEADRWGGNEPGLVVGCTRPQGEGPLFFFVPVEGGAVRVPVCEAHAEHLGRLYGNTGEGSSGEA